MESVLNEFGLYKDVADIIINYKEEMEDIEIMEKYLYYDSDDESDDDVDIMYDCNWADLSRKEKLTEDFIRRFSFMVDWEYICKYQKLSVEFLREFEDEYEYTRKQRYDPETGVYDDGHYTPYTDDEEVDIDVDCWYYISQYQTLSEDFIRDFQDKVAWSCITRYQQLSGSFLIKYKDKMSNWQFWDNISEYQTLSEDFIRNNKNEIKWGNISRCQKLSRKFIREFKDKIDFDYIRMNKKISCIVKNQLLPKQRTYITMRIRRY